MALLITAVIPIIVFNITGFLLLGQLREAAANYASTTGHQQVLTGLGNLLESMATAGVRSGAPSNSEILGAIARLAGAIVGLLASLGFSILDLLLNLVIVITIVAPLLIYYDRVMDWIQRFSPFPMNLGVIYGPVITAVFVTAIEVYLKYYPTSDERQLA